MHARLRHLEHQVVALARALADAGEDRDAAVLQRDVVDQLLDQDGLAGAGAAEEADLAAADVRRDQVDDLDARLEDLDRRGELAEGRRVAVDRPALALRRPPCRRWGRRSRSRCGRASGRRRARRSAARCPRSRRRARGRRSCPSRRRGRDRRRDAAAPPRSARVSPPSSGTSTLSAWLISGSRSGKTASSTTPLISTIFPVFLPLLLSATESPRARVRRARGRPQARAL